MVQYYPVVTGSLTVIGDLSVTGTSSVTASNAITLDGTGSLAFVTSASFNSFTGSTYLPFSSSVSSRTTALETASGSFSLILTAVSSSNQQLSASYISLSGSYNTFSGSASTRITVDSASLQQVSASQQQISSSYIALSASYNTFSGSASTRVTKIENNYATTGSNSFRADQSITGSLVVSSTITAQTLIVQTVTSSIVYSSGSNIFGSQLTDRQTFTGSVNITGSLAIAGNITGNAITLTGALNGTSATFSSSVQVGNSSGGTMLTVGTSGTGSFGSPTAIQMDNSYQSTVGNRTGLKFYLYKNGTETYGFGLNSEAGVEYHTSGYHGFYTVNAGTCTEKMHITSGGNVGIGTSVVTEGTQAAGSISIFPSSSVSSAPLIQFPSNGRIRPASTSDRLSLEGNALYLNNVFSGNIIMATGGGNVGIGTTSPSYLLDVNGTGRFSGNVLIGSATNTNELNIYATTSPTIKFQNSGADRGKISSNSSALIYNSLTGNGHNFQIDGVNKFTLATSTGDATFSGNVTGGGKGYFAAGVQFGSGSSTLNYYQEGSWSPQLYAGSNAFTMTGLTSGRYVRIGNMVSVSGHIQWSSGTGSGIVKIAGLPFASSGVRSAGSIGAVSSGISFDSGYGSWILVNDPSTDFIYIIQLSTSGQGYSHTPPVASSGIIYGFSITYQIL